MLELKLKDNSITCCFDNIKIIQYSYPTLLCKLIQQEELIWIDEKPIKLNNIVYINEFSKLSDFLNLNKSSFLLKKIIDLINNQPLINYNLLQKVIDDINNWLNVTYLDLNEGDETKIINFLLEISKDITLNQELLLFLLKNDCFSSKMCFIFDNVSWLNKQELYPYLNQHYFLIVTSDFRNYFHTAKDFELVCILHEDLKYFDVVDSTKLLNYLELKLNIPVSIQTINESLRDKTSWFSMQVFYYLNLIE